jgi:hypothetical protein
VQRLESSLRADLTLVGTPCNVYGEDLQDLKFLAEWQTGTSAIHFTAESYCQYARVFILDYTDRI